MCVLLCSCSREFSFFLQVCAPQPMLFEDALAVDGACIMVDWLCSAVPLVILFLVLDFFVETEGDVKILQWRALSRKTGAHSIESLLRWPGEVVFVFRNKTKTQQKVKVCNFVRQTLLDTAPALSEPSKRVNKADGATLHVIDIVIDFLRDKYWPRASECGGDEHACDTSCLPGCPNRPADADVTHSGAEVIELNGLGLK